MGREALNVNSTIREYKSLYLVVKLFNVIYGFTMMAAKSVLAGVAIVSLCFSVRTKGEGMGAVAGILGADLALVVATAFSCLAEFHRRSHKVLRHLKISPNCRQNTKSGKAVIALQPIAFKIGRLYYVDKMMVLTLLELITTATANMLLLLPAE